MTTPAVRSRSMLLALGATGSDVAEIELFATLAAELGARLAGLFVADTNLLRWGGLPFARELGERSARERALAAADMERSLRALASRRERELALIARRLGLDWSWQHTEGPWLASVLARTAEHEIVVVPAAVATQRTPSPAPAVAVAVHEASRMARPLDVAAGLARRRRTALRLLHPPALAAQARAATRQLEPGSPISLQAIGPGDGEALLSAVLAARIRLLVLAAQVLHEEPRLLDRLIQAGVSVVLVD